MPSTSTSSNDSKKSKAKTSKAAKAPKKAVERSVEDIYQKMGPHEHILTIPDTYIGGIDEDVHSMWVVDDTNKMVFKQISYVPGLYKIFDEIIVNARDHSINDKSCRTIKVNVNKQTGEISCYNDGQKGIPVVVHKEHKVWVPHMIFGMLLTSGNYNQKGKTVGGKNGYGAKLANIFSTNFYVEVVDSERKKKFTQEYKRNMYDVEDPVITDVPAGTKSHTIIRFTPDYKKFGINGITNDILSLFRKRVYDTAALTRDNLKVYFNDHLIDINNFRDYIDMFYSKEDAIAQPVFEKVNDRWKVAVLYDPDAGYRHISYVNGICTYKGGNHVNHVADQVITALAKFINEKHKNLNVKNVHIRDNLTLFIDSVVEDPAFSSQTKEELTSKLSSFGSRCDISDSFIKELAKTGIVDEVVNFATLKAMSALKKSDGKKTTSLIGLDKLEDAKWAGGRKSNLCRLILTEGDSAKAFAVAGTDVIGRDKYGVFPLKGKLLNVREATPAKLADNEEIKNIKKIMGLKHGKKYTNLNELRYGGILILTDQDTDGSHIKGLLMNFIHFFWPSLLKTKGFIQSIATPIVKAWKLTDINKKNCKIFYTLTEYEDWIKTLPKDTPKASGWKIKYFKGLGSSTDKEAKESFKDFDNNIINYVWTSDDKDDKDDKDNKDTKDAQDDQEEASDEENVEDALSDSKSVKSDDFDYETDKTNKCYDAISLAFSKNRADHRKTWLKSYKREEIIDNSTKVVSYYDFIHRDLKHFSNYSCIRAVPSMCDGLKPSQRKILYTALKKKLFKDEIKVAQLSGYVSAEAGYHHGEVSLQGAIITMAQNFIGSNNLNVLTPNGQFGTRKVGGKDHASARYIHTQLNELTPLIFRKEDELVYKYIDDDGDVVEPENYSPIIPMILVNGCNGIGTAYSTTIPSYNPLDLIKIIKKMISNGGKFVGEMKPWYHGFTGQITKIKSTQFKSHGKYQILSENKVMITELPIGSWTTPYLSMLKSMLIDEKKPTKDQIFTDVSSDCGNNSVKITVTFKQGVQQKLLKSDTLVKTLKLTKSLNISNMHLYNYKGVITKYNTIGDLVTDYYNHRLEVYELRKAHYLKFLDNKLNLLKYKILFLNYVITGKIIVFENKVARSKSDVVAKLEELNFPKLNSNIDSLELSYTYITNLPLFALTPEEMKKLQDELDQQKKETDIYRNTSILVIWNNELDELSKEYSKWLIKRKEEDEDNDNDDGKDGKKKKKKKKAVIKN